VEASIDAFVADVAAELPPATTTTTTTTTSPCVASTFDFTINSTGGGAGSDSHWNGEVLTMGSAPCTVTVKAPSGDIVAAGDAWTIAGFAGFSACTFAGGCDGHGGACTGCNGVDAPSSCPFAGIPNCTNNRPTCSVGLNGNATDSAHVQCVP
jgi:hypothetical protein